MAEQEPDKATVGQETVKSMPSEQSDETVQDITVVESPLGSILILSILSDPNFKRSSKDVATFLKQWVESANLKKAAQMKSLYWLCGYNDPFAETATNEALDALFERIEHIRETMKSDQEEIDRLRVETRAMISELLAA